MSRFLRSRRALITVVSAGAMVAAAASGAYAATGRSAGAAAGDSTLARSAPAAPAIVTQPVVYAGYHDAPISLPGTLGTILTLRVPSSGNYAIFGKLTVWDGQNVDTLITCELVAGADVDRSDVDLTGNTVPYANYGAMALNVVHHFSRPGNVNLVCTGYGTTTTASWIKITAIHVGTLTNTALP